MLVDTREGRLFGNSLAPDAQQSITALPRYQQPGANYIIQTQRLEEPRPHFFLWDSNSPCIIYEPKREGRAHFTPPYHAHWWLRAIQVLPLHS